VDSVAVSHSAIVSNDGQYDMPYRTALTHSEVIAHHAIMSRVLALVALDLSHHAIMRNVTDIVKSDFTGSLTGLS
jgi:hypothetical protein